MIKNSGEPPCPQVVDFVGVFFLLTQNFSFLWIKTPCKISEPNKNSFWEKSNGELEKKEDREKTLLIVDI